MIIEGSHKVMGKGIFISDIAQGGLAFKVTYSQEPILNFITKVVILTYSICMHVRVNFNDNFRQDSRLAT